MTKVIETHPELEELLKEFKTETVAEEALRILEPIPENRWCIFTRLDDKGRSCGLGHYGMHHGNKPYGPIVKRLVDAADSYGYNLANVNNGDLSFRIRYPQPTPKQRVIALLQDMLKAGY